MITITFPDGKKKEYKKGTTALDIAKGISEGLAREVLAAKVNGEVVDAFKPIEKDASLELLKFKDPDGLEIFRHSSAHLLAQAVTELFPHARLTIGPVCDEGFYYDIDHEPFTPDDLAKIEAKAKEIAGRKDSVSRLVLKKSEAKKMFKDNPFKQEILDEIEDETVTAYQQGEFIDLCRGPHVPNVGMIKALKILKVAGAYWRANQKNKQLQRIYGISFPDKKDLRKHLHMLEEAKKRDHRVLGKKMGLFSFHEESPGAVFYQPKGTIIFRELQEFIREQYRQRGFSEVITPLVYDKSLWETSGHWEHYHENMFVFEVDGKTVSLKPMNCPSHCLMFGESIKSYRELPLRIADFASLHRNELRGVLGGMTRVRKFNQDDSHIFCTPEQLNQEIHNELDFAKFVYADTFNFEYHLELSTRPEKSMGTDKQWKLAETALKSAFDDKSCLML